MTAYAITDPSILGFDTLRSDLERIAAKADMIVYRDKHNPDYARNAAIFLSYAKELGFDRVLLHTDIALAAGLGADGVHLTSSRIEFIPEAKANGLFIIVSTHTPEEALMAQELGADMITYSPIFASPGKGIPIGSHAIIELKKQVSIPVIALGGIVTQEQIAEVERAGASGFASIRYFGVS